MIRVPSPITEPPTFDTVCRQKGRQWLEEHSEVQGRPPDYWSPFRDDLREGFVRRCGYFAMYLHDGTVDHFISWETCKESRPELAYEWSNYRFIAPSLNSKKGTLDDQLLDPFEVQDGWFEVEIPSFVLRITDRLPAPLRAKAKFTFDRLDLQYGRKAVALRREWYELFREGHLTEEGLRRNAPLVADAVRRWQRDGKGALPAVPRPIA